MEYEPGPAPARKAEHTNDYTIITAAMIEAAAIPSTESSHRRLLLSVRESTGYQLADVAAVMMELINHGVLERSINIKRRGSALTPLGMEAQEQLRRLADQSN
jgi:hypothetical protein